MKLNRKQIEIIYHALSFLKANSDEVEWLSDNLDETVTESEIEEIIKAVGDLKYD